MLGLSDEGHALTIDNVETLWPGSVSCAELVGHEVHAYGHLEAELPQLLGAQDTLIKALVGVYDRHLGSKRPRVAGMGLRNVDADKLTSSAVLPVVAVENWDVLPERGSGHRASNQYERPPFLQEICQPTLTHVRAIMATNA